MIDPHSHGPQLECPSAPEGTCLCSTLSVRVNDQALPVYHSAAGNFAYFSTDQAVNIEVETIDKICGAWITPWHFGIKPEISDRSLSFNLDKPRHLIVQINDGPALFLFANPIESIPRPDPEDPKVHFFEAGAIHEIGILEISSDETVYIEGGAIVKGFIHAIDGHNVRIHGRGVLDGSCYSCLDSSPKSILMERCSNSLIEGIILINPNTWMITLGDCDHIKIDNIKEISESMSTNGVVICGSRDVELKNSFLRNNDDCVTILANSCLIPEKRNRYAWCEDVSHIKVHHCTFLNSYVGNVMEIGSETRTESISNVHFHHIDVVGAHGEGAVFAITAGDRATISDITWEDIRVEHFYDKLIDFRIVETRWSKDSERGHIKGILLKNIKVCKDHFNTPSLIGGFDREHLVEDVSFDNFVLGGQKVLDEDTLGLFTKHARNIRFIN